MNKIIIKKLKVFAYHGVNPEEKVNGQNFELDITANLNFSNTYHSDNLDDTVSYAKISKEAIKAMQEKKFDLIESAANFVSNKILEKFPQIQSITLTLKKPEAPVKADFKYMAVKIKKSNITSLNSFHEAAISLGSNLGNKLENIEKAINFLNSLHSTEIVKISKFYETEPFQCPDKQQNYINCCVKLKTKLSPQTLLGACLGIESSLERKRLYKNSPRTIDLDLLFYDNIKINTEELILPHPRILERAFVLIPLSDLYPEKKTPSFDFSKEFSVFNKNCITIKDVVRFGK